MTSETRHRDTTVRNVQTHTGNPTLDDSDVHAATRNEYSSTASIIDELLQQRTVSPLDDANCCDGGDHGFRVYKTEFPVIRHADLEPSLLVYRPTTSPLTVYEIASEPYTNEHGSQRVDVIAHSRSHAGDNPDIRAREDSLHVASVVDEMTFVQPSTVQETLADCGGR